MLTRGDGMNFSSHMHVVTPERELERGEASFPLLWDIAQISGIIVTTKECPAEQPPTERNVCLVRYGKSISFYGNDMRCRGSDFPFSQSV